MSGRGREQTKPTHKKGITNMFNTLTIDEITRKLNERKNGTFVTVTFYSEPKTIDGSKIYKLTKMQSQCKVDYTHKKDYVEPTYHRNEDVTYTIDKALKHNNNTGNDLLILYPFGDKGALEKLYFNANGMEISEEQAKAVIKPKAPSKNPLVYMTVNAKNVVSIV